MASQVAINDLDLDHLDAFQISLWRILSTPLAEYTFAQIIDGLPTKHDDSEYLFGYDPNVSDRDAPTAYAYDQVGKWRSVFQVESLTFDAGVAQAYQNTTIGTRDFHLRLIEMIAIALHAIASNLFAHTNKPPYKCPEPQLSLDDIQECPWLSSIRPDPTYLYHEDYECHEQYPMGIPDIVGYWAEHRLLGGVVLFDRGESEEEFRDVYLHPNAGFRIFKLSETQIDQFVDFCLYGEDSTPCPFPMKAERWALRLFPDEAFDLHIFRDKYERNPPVRFADRTTHERPRWEDNPEAQELQEQYMIMVKRGDFDFN